MPKELFASVLGPQIARRQDQVGFVHKVNQAEIFNAVIIIQIAKWNMESFKPTSLFSFLILLYLMFQVSWASGQSSIEDGDAGQVICKCTWLGKCKSSRSGAICAQSAENGNIQCSNYNGNS